MKKNLFLSLLALTCLLVGLVNGCKKDSLGNSATGIATSFTEEFDTVYKLESRGWVIKDNSESFTGWAQAGGATGGKVPTSPAFPAYSYTIRPDEYIAAHVSVATTYYSVSSWLLTPVLSVKNGDKISFYTRADTGSVYKDRLQVLMNNSVSKEVGGNVSSVGGFTMVVLDINSAQAASGYPITWTKYEYTFAGLSGKISTRIGFRYFVPGVISASGIGLDLFKFESN